MDFEDWRIDVWLLDGNAVLRNVEVATREDRLPQQHADFSIDPEMVAIRDGRLSRLEGDLVP